MKAIRCLHRRDLETPVLLVLDEGFEVSTFQFPEIPLTRSSVEAEEEHDRGEGTVERAPLVVQTGLVDQVALELFLCGSSRGESRSRI